MLSSWLSIPQDSDFSLQNLPFGVFSPSPSSAPRCATILGDTVVDLSALEEAGLFEDIPNLSANVFNQPTLNAFIEHPRPVWILLRQRLVDLFTVHGPVDKLRTNENLQKTAFFSASSVSMKLPLNIGDYTDFYSSREHATNCGIMFRGKDDALQPNWLHLPVGYHGRASTVFVSGQDVRRPMGQLQKDNDDPKQGSIYGACRLLDFELEVAAVVGGPPNPVGYPLNIEQAKDRIFGYLLMNDWSARDIQKWESLPLGPFTAKNFATTVSPWIVMAAALAPFVTPTSAGEQTDPVPLDYLKDPTYSSYDISLSVGIGSKDQSTDHIVCRSNFRNLYWDPAQQLVHHTVTGCVMQPGDILGSGTISGQDPSSFGSLLELSWKGTKEVVVGDEVRKFLKDGDTVVLRGFSHKEGVGRVGFGECKGTVLQAFTDGVPVVANPTPSVERYQDIKLYGYWRSSSTWRVRVALAAKGLSYETIPIDLLKSEQKAESYLLKNPLGQVPLLECTDTFTGEIIRLSQSVAIIEFLDSAFPKRRSMIPKDSVDRAAAMEMVELINAGTQPLQNIFVLKEYENLSSGKISATEQAKIINERGLKALELLAKQRREQFHGPFCFGTHSPNIVDACIIPQLYNARRFGVDVDNLFPVLAEVDAVCAKHPWFVASHPAAQPDAVQE